MIKRWITIAASAALLAPLSAPPLLARDLGGPDEPESREVRERDVPEREVREVRESQERESREDRTTEAGEAGEAKEVGEAEQEDSGGAAAEMASAWQDDALRDEAADRDEAGNPVRQGEVIAFGLPASAERQLAASGYRVIHRTPLASLGEEVVRLAVPRGRELAAALREVRALAPDAIIDYEHYYGLGLASRGKPKRIKAPRAAAPAVQHFAVGMIDTAVAPHPVLGGARVIAWKPGADPKAAAGHGTAVASLMAVQGADVIYSANIFRGSPSRPFTSIDILAEAMEWLIGQGAPVINMSIAGPPNALLDKLVALAAARGRIVVASAGNGGPAAAPAYPAALSSVVAVTAVDPALRVYRYANHGRYIAVAAQGVGVQAARAEGGFARFTGTSFASPLVAARLARCRAAGASALVCKEQMMKSARDLGTPGFDETYGNGYVE